MTKQKHLPPTNTSTLPPGFPTHTTDICGVVICIGDTCAYAIEGTERATTFEVVFEENAIRKKFKKWDKNLVKPILTHVDVELFKIEIVTAATPPNHLLPTHLTIMEYAKKTGQSRTTIYNSIEDGKIIPDYVGESKSIPMIDFAKYKNVEFRKKSPKTG